MEAASATGKYCTNYDAEVKALKQAAQVVIDLTDTNSEDVVFPTDSRSVLDSLAGHGEHNPRRKLYIILEHRRVIIPLIPTDCGNKGNKHANRLAKEGALKEVLDSLAGHGEHNPRRKLYIILEHRRVIIPLIPTDCGNKGNKHANRLAKEGANMEHEKLPIPLKQKKQNNEEQVQSKEDTR